MSFLLVEPDLVTAAAANLAGIRSALSEAAAAASTPTTALASAGADEVSAAVSRLFGAYGQQFQALNARAATFHAEFVSLLNGGAAAYTGAEAASVSSMQALLDAVNAPTQTLLGRPLIGNGADGVAGTGSNAGGNGGPGGILYGNGGNGGAADPTAGPAVTAGRGLIGNGAQTPRKTNPWPLVAGAAAVVLVLVLGAIGIWIAIRPKPVQPPQPVAEERLSALLLNSSEVNAVMGSSSMQPGKPITSMDSSPVTVSLPDCQGALYTSQDPVYAGTGYTAINGLISSEPGDNYEHWVNQAVVAFPTADKARAFVQTSADKWKNCAGKTVTVTNKAKTYRWTFADVKGSPPTITVIDTQEGAEGWECQRAMSVANNVVVDVNACGYQITNQAGQIAAKIVDKVNKE